MAHYLATEGGKRVLVVDLDPQCNATQLLLSDEQWDDIFSDGTAKDDKRTVLHALRNIRRGDSGVASDYEVVHSERFKVDVLAGHPSLALMEDTFSSSWEAFIAGDLGGARRTHWLSQLVKAATTYDLVILDAGPSLGALNRTVVVGTDYFVTPTAADMFSLFAIDNIGEWIRTWTRKYLIGLAGVKEEFGSEVDDLIPDSLGLEATYLGYTIQQYVTKAMRGGERRKLNAYDRYKKQIPAKARNLSKIAPGAVEDLSLGLVPHMFAMVPLAQACHAPISALLPQDGLRGAQISQQANYREQLRDIGQKLIKSWLKAEDSK